MKSTILKVAFLSLATMAISNAGVILSENFDGASIIDYDGTAGVIPGTIFSLVAGTIDVDGPTASIFQSACSGLASGQCIDTQGGFGLGNTTLGEIATTNPTVYAPGSYVLTFVLNGWADPNNGDTESATVLVRLGPGGSLVNQSVSVNGANDPYPLVVIPFTVGVSTSAILDFQTTADSTTFAGGILDNIQISSVPEPGSVVLVGLGLVGSLIAARRRIFTR